MFKAFIDNDVKLTNIEKLQHLKSCLKGSALDTVSLLEICDGNYAVALDLLNNRFNTKRLIFQCHIMAIFGFPKVDMQFATSMGSVEQISNCILVHALLQKLDGKTQDNWKESANVDEIPSIDQFTTFFPKRCHKLENVEHTAALFSNSSQSGRSRNKSILIATNFLGNGCVVCNNSGHSTYSCGKFAKLSPQERIRNVKELALCLNCLKKGHQMRSCKSSCCRTCRSKLTPFCILTLSLRPRFCELLLQNNVRQLQLLQVLLPLCWLRMWIQTLSF